MRKTSSDGNGPPWFLRPLLWVFDLFLTLLFGKGSSSPEQERLDVIDRYLQELESVIDSESLGRLEQKLSTLEKRLRKNASNMMQLSMGRYAVGSSAPDVGPVGPEIPEQRHSERPIPLKEAQALSVMAEMALWRVELLQFEIELLTLKKKAPSELSALPHAVDWLLESVRWVSPETKFQNLKLAKELVLNMKNNSSEAELENWSGSMVAFRKAELISPVNWFESRLKMIDFAGCIDLDG